jgi:ATP-binding cassette subfamily A (ABC1) protein 3
MCALSSMTEFVPLLITLGLLYPVSAMVRYITLEKELRQKELMKMMSVTESDIGWSWFLSLWGLHFVSATIVALVSTQLWTNSDFGQIWIFWEFTMLAVVVFSMFIAAFFSKSTPATLVGLLVFFAGYFLTLIVSYDEGNTNTIALISLHPVGAFSFGLQEIGRLEDLQIGLNADTNSSTDSPSGYTFNNTLQSLIFDCVLWGVLSWYFNRVIQGDFGQALPWYFPFTSSYWCPGRAKAHPQDDTIAEVVYDEGLAVEPVPDAVKEQMKDGKSIEIRNLRKTFGEKTAVDGLSMSMYRNQITALLGK